MRRSALLIPALALGGCLSGAWHAHAGRLMVKAFGLVPHGAHEDDRPRLAMLHAWTGVPNPDGVFAADNWALPFARAGLAVPALVPPDAGRAVALASGYQAFYRQAVVRTAAPSPEVLAQIEAALARRADAVRALLGQHPVPDPGALAAEWGRPGAEVEAIAPDLWPRLAALFGAHSHSGTHAIADGD